MKEATTAAPPWIDDDGVGVEYEGDRTEPRDVDVFDNTMYGDDVNGCSRSEDETNWVQC